MLTPEELLSLLRARRSIRRYRPDPVPEALVEQLLEAGRWAPSAGNRQPWRFVVVREPAMRQRVAELAAYGPIRWPFVAEAPLLIVLCGDARVPIYRQFLHEDIGLAGAQIMLQAHALGLGTCWVGGLDRQGLAALLKLPPHVRIIGLLTVGFPAEQPPPRSRKPLTELVHYEVYGNADPRTVPAPGAPSGGWLRHLLSRLRIAYRA